jgi:hypothetical protein
MNDARRHAARLLLAATFAVPGCAWVKLTDAGAAVAVRDAADVGACSKVGVASVRTATVAGVRPDRKIIEEVLVMAKNQAADLGGNAIVASTPLTDGGQKFDVYRCP